MLGLFFSSSLAFCCVANFCPPLGVCVFASNNSAGRHLKNKTQKNTNLESLWGVQKCTKSVPGMVEMMPWAPLGVSRRPQWHQKPPREAPGGVRRSIFISFYQFGRHGGGKAEGNWMLGCSQSCKEQVPSLPVWMSRFVLHQ